MRCFKAFSTEPSYGTYQTTRQYSRLAREHPFPYPFYFVSNPFSEEPEVHLRRAGWSPQVPHPRPALEPDPYPDHCFQTPCNTTSTVSKPPLPPPIPVAGRPSAADAPRRPPRAARSRTAPVPTGGGAPVPAAGGGASGRAAAGSGCVASKCVNTYR